MQYTCGREPASEKRAKTLELQFGSRDYHLAEVSSSIFAHGG